MSASTVGSATKSGTKIGSAACASTSASSPANVVVERTGSLSAYSIDLLLQSACPDPLSTHISPLPLLPLCVARAELKKRRAESGTEATIATRRKTESVVAGATVLAASAESEYRALCWGRARAALEAQGDSVPLAMVNVHCAQPGGAFEDDDGGQYVHHDQGQGFDDQGQECDQEQDQDCYHEDSGHGHDGKHGHECAEDAEGDEHEEGHGYSQHAGCTDYHGMQNLDECEDGPQAEYAEHADDAEDHNSYHQQNSECQAQETELPLRTRSYGESGGDSSYGGSFPSGHGSGYCDGGASDIGGDCDHGFAEQANADDDYGYDGGDYGGCDY